MDPDPVIHTVRMPSRVRQMLLLKRGGENHPADAYTNRRHRIRTESPAIVYGSPSINGRDFRHTSGECEKAGLLNTAAEAEQKKIRRGNRTKKKIAEIQRIMLCHPSFQSLKADGRTTKTIQSASLTRWTQEYSKKVKYTQNMCERALSDLMECHILRAELIQTQHKGGNLKKDVVKTRYKLWMDSGSYANMFKEFPDINRANPFLDTGVYHHQRQ